MRSMRAKNVRTSYSVLKLHASFELIKLKTGWGCYEDGKILVWDKGTTLAKSKVYGWSQTKSSWTIEDK